MKKILFLFLTLCSVSGIVHSDITWSTPVAISTAATNASDPHVVIDANGNATGAWVESGIIKASTLPLGGSWSTPVPISNILNTSSNPRLGVDGSGNVTAVWVETVSGSGVIESASLPFGGIWSSETAVSQSGASSPSLAVDSSGNAVAVWVRSTFIESSTKISGTWSLVSVLSASNSDNPHVAICSAGTAMAVWHNKTVSNTDSIISDSLTLSTNTWAASKNVFSGTAALLHNYPKVALDSSGNANVAWYRYNLIDSNSYQNVQVAVSSLTAGGASWSIGTLLSAAGMRNPADLTIRLRFDTNGDAVAVWTNSYDGEIFAVEASQRLFGGAWSASSEEVNAPTIYSFGMDISMAGGAALLTYMYWDGTTLSIQSQESDIGDPIALAWTPPTSVTSASDNGYPSCAMELSGSTYNAVVVWNYFDGTNDLIYASSGTDSIYAPPASVSASQTAINFGVYIDYANTITWTSNSDPNVVAYLLYRNGAFFTLVSPSTLSFVDHNQINGGTVTYGVAALSSSIRESTIITYTLFP